MLILLNPLVLVASVLCMSCDVSCHTFRSQPKNKIFVMIIFPCKKYLIRIHRMTVSQETQKYKFPDQEIIVQSKLNWSI